MDSGDIRGMRKTGRGTEEGGPLWGQGNPVF